MATGIIFWPTYLAMSLLLPQLYLYVGIIIGVEIALITLTTVVLGALVGKKLAENFGPELAIAALTLSSIGLFCLLSSGVPFLIGLAATAESLLELALIPVLIAGSAFIALSALTVCLYGAQQLFEKALAIFSGYDSITPSPTATTTDTSIEVRHLVLPFAPRQTAGPLNKPSNVYPRVLASCESGYITDDNSPKNASGSKKEYRGDVSEYISEDNFSSQTSDVETDENEPVQRPLAGMK